MFKWVCFCVKRQMTPPNAWLNHQSSTKTPWGSGNIAPPSILVRTLVQTCTWTGAPFYCNGRRRRDTHQTHAVLCSSDRPSNLPIPLTWRSWMSFSSFLFAFVNDPFCMDSSLTLSVASWSWPSTDFPRLLRRFQLRPRVVQIIHCRRHPSLDRSQLFQSFILTPDFLFQRRLEVRQLWNQFLGVLFRFGSALVGGIQVRFQLIDILFQLLLCSKSFRLALGLGLKG